MTQYSSVICLPWYHIVVECANNNVVSLRVRTKYFQLLELNYIRDTQRHRWISKNVYAFFPLYFIYHCSFLDRLFNLPHSSPFSPVFILLFLHFGLWLFQAQLFLSFFLFLLSFLLSVLLFRLFYVLSTLTS
jgi:hypothetical protein